ncbi:hypothetical protein ACFCW4_06825 [Streptomyces virginiae]|uniref:hypothetical protein n=1 Tax=Streptomyces virginiae TaxID=1961 RepID=UPI0035D59BEC
MSLFLEALPEFLGGLGTAVVLGFVGWLLRRRVANVRRYTLLSTAGPDGNPVYHLSTLPVGTVVARDINGRRERFKLTDAQLPDRTFAAEPIDRYV